MIGCEIGVWSSLFLFYLFDINNACAHIFFDCAYVMMVGCSFKFEMIDSIESIESGESSSLE